MDCAKAILSSAYIDKSLSTNATNLIYSLTNAYNNTLLDSEITEILDIVSSAADFIDKFSIINLIKLLGLNFKTNAIPGLSYNYTSSKLVFYLSTLFWYNLPSLAINLNTTKLLLPSDLQVEPSDVFDLSFAHFKFSDEIFNLNITKSGTYQNYSLNLLSQNQDSIVSVSSYISLIIAGSFSSSSRYQCLELKDGNWESGNCSVYQVSSENITLHFKSDSVYFVTPKTIINCDLGFGPIATMSVLIFLMIVLSLIFFVIDKVVKEVPVLLYKSLLVYPLTGLFFKQPNPFRAALVTQLLTCELLMLALIGASHQYFDNPTEPNNFTFADYYLSQMSRGAAAWALCQVFTFPIYFINAYNVHKSQKLHYITIPVCIIITFLCFGAIVAMTTQYCAGITIYWIINFLIFLLLDLATLQIIYALIITYLLQRRFITPRSIQISSVVCSEEESKNDGKIRKLNSDENLENIKTTRPLIQEIDEPEITVEESYYQSIPNSDQEY